MEWGEGIWPETRTFEGMESTLATTVMRWTAGAMSGAEADVVAVEEPLEIQAVHGGGRRTLSVTMRTPGADADLARGFLFTEGAIASEEDVERVVEGDHAVEVHLRHALRTDWAQLERHVYVSSSCGVCGKTSLDAVRQTCTTTAPECTMSADVLGRLPERLREAQRAFDATGGIHAAGWFTLDGELLAFAEDVGRHNALDKLIGELLRTDRIPLKPGAVLLSGRASFELIQKARLAGAAIVAAVGAPSSLAVELAADGNVTLVGFLRRDRFNVYTGAHRIAASPAIPCP